MSGSDDYLTPEERDALDRRLKEQKTNPQRIRESALRILETPAVEDRQGV